MSPERLEGRATTAEAVLIGALLFASLLVSYLLPVSLFQAALAVTLAGVIATVAFLPGAWPTLYRATGVSVGAWLIALAVAAGGIGLSHLVGDPRAFCDGVAHRGCLTGYGYASALWLASSLAVAITVGHAGRYRRIRRASVEPAAAVDAGPVAVEGRITPASGTVVGPVSGEPTVWHRTVTERPTVFDGHLQVEPETDGGEFFVEDGSDRLLVYPEGLDAHDVAALARSETGTTDGGDRRRREWSYRPDDAVTVIGSASDVSRAEYPEPVVVGIDGPVIVGLGTRGDLLAWAARRALVGGGLAVIAGGASLLAMLAAA